jgi:hypothetical protein
MSALVTSPSNRLDLVKHNVYVNEQGQLIAAKKEIASFLADYGETNLPGLPSNTSTTVSSVESGANSLISQQELYERNVKISEIENALSIIAQRVSQANGFINRLNAAKGKLIPLTSSQSNSIKQQATSLLSTANSYLSALGSAISTLNSTKSSLQQALESL